MYKELISPLLDRLDSETWHVRAREALHVAEAIPGAMQLIRLVAGRGERFCDDRLNVRLAHSGLEFDNPLIGGAGWDKEGRAVLGLWWLGFAGDETGGVLQHPQCGNDKPRQFMIAPGVGLNELGFNTSGMIKVGGNLRRYVGSGIPIGVNVARNKEVTDPDAPAAHVIVVGYLYAYANWFTLGVSSINTPGLRRSQEKGPLTDIVQAVNSVRDNREKVKPLYVKIAPDLELPAVDNVCRVLIDNHGQGLVIANTTGNVRIKAKYGAQWASERRGLSGDDPEYRAMVYRQICHVYRNYGSELEIMGAGGIKDAATALQFIRAGACPLQIVTAIRGEGPFVADTINRGLVTYMKQTGVKSIQDLVGVDVR